MTPLNAPAAAQTSLVRRLWTRHRPALASGLLAATLVFMGVAQSRLRDGRLAVRAAEQRLAQATLEDKQSQQRVALAQFAGSFMKQAARLQLDPSRWAEQAIAVRQGRMSRLDAVALLLQAQTHEGHVFGAQEFDISSASLQSGLFVDASSPKEELVVTLRGRTRFKTR